MILIQDLYGKDTVILHLLMDDQAPLIDLSCHKVIDSHLPN